MVGQTNIQTYTFVRTMKQRTGVIFFFEFFGKKKSIKKMKAAFNDQFFIPMNSEKYTPLKLMKIYTPEVNENIHP